MAEGAAASSSGADIEEDMIVQSGTISHPKALKSENFKKVTAKVDLSRADLVRLLSYLEGELQARDVVIATLKTEKAKQVLYQAKYGRLGLNDPLAALQRDSAAVDSSDDFDENEIGRMYESQLAQLEKLISVQRRSHHRAKHVLSAAERRHCRTIRELETEKQRNAADAAQGDDVCMMLEKEREKLRSEMEHERMEREKWEKEVEKRDSALEEEKERHQAIVFYLMNERAQLVQRMLEERQKASKADKEVDIQLLRQLVKELKTENDALKRELDQEREESASIKEIVRTQEEDLNLIRQNILAKTRQLAQQGQGGTSTVNSDPATSGSKTGTPPPRQPVVKPVHPSKQLHLNRGASVDTSSSRASSGTPPYGGTIPVQRSGNRATSSPSGNGTANRFPQLPPNGSSSSARNSPSNVSGVSGRVLTNPGFAQQSASSNPSPLSGSGSRTTPFPVTSSDFNPDSPASPQGAAPARNLAPGSSPIGIRRQMSAPGAPPPNYASSSAGAVNTLPPSASYQSHLKQQQGPRGNTTGHYRSTSTPQKQNQPTQPLPAHKRRTSTDSRTNASTASLPPHQVNRMNLCRPVALQQKVDPVIELQGDEDFEDQAEVETDTSDADSTLEPEIAHLEEVINSLGGVKGLAITGIIHPDNGSSGLKKPTIIHGRTQSSERRNNENPKTENTASSNGSPESYQHGYSASPQSVHPIKYRGNLPPPPNPYHNEQYSSPDQSTTTFPHTSRQGNASINSQGSFPNGTGPSLLGVTKRTPTPVPPFRVPLPPAYPPPPSSVSSTSNPLHQTGSANSGIPIVTSNPAPPFTPVGGSKTGTIKRNPLAGMVGNLSKLTPNKTVKTQRTKKKATQV